MVNEEIRRNAGMLGSELEWLGKVLEARLGGRRPDAVHPDPLTLLPPPVDADSPYGTFLSHYEFSVVERLVLILAAAPHVRPEALDPFSARRTEAQWEGAEWGGLSDPGGKAFLPTAQTALYLLGGDNLGDRLRAAALFRDDHVFRSHHLLRVERPRPGEPMWSGLLVLEPALVSWALYGETFRPDCSPDFPARRLTTPMEWGDLVLEETTMEQIREIRAWMEHGDTLLRDFGLEAKVKPGYRALFHGPPGTGKSLTAALLGKASGRDVFRIDLSQTVSKYIGETEKNLERVFHEAEHRQWILFFDEADALFGKRTGIQDAQDRFANQEISYLLQRVEDFAGTVILATNLKANLDHAFLRRFQAIIHFGPPGERERLRLWRSLIPDGRSPDSGFTPEDLARNFEVTGGMMVNVVRYAALAAVMRGRKAFRGMDLENGIRREFEKAGRTI